MELNELTITSAITGLKEKKFSSGELTKCCLGKIELTDKKIKAFITVCSDRAMEAAKKCDRLIADAGYPEDKKLFGIPLAIKDNFCTQGIRTTAGSKVLEDYVPVYDATVVRKLRENGAVILGKTNMDAWAHGSSTETSQFFTTCNPWNYDFLPGGSSGGSTAAVASGEAIAAIGSETAGSIRQPASWCGVTGLKPTYGRVSRYGLIAMCSSTDSPGSVTKNVEDAVQILSVIAGKDDFDATSSKKLLELTRFSKNLHGLKIGLPKQYFLKDMEKEVGASVEKAVKTLEGLGAEIIWVDLLDPKYSISVYTIIQRSEVSSNLARFDGIRYGNGRNAFGDEAKRRIMLGTYALSAGYYDRYYVKAQKVRNMIIKDFDRVFSEVDIIACPVSPTVALKVGATKDQVMFGELQDELVEASSLAGLPGLSLPCGFGRDKLPVGFQLIGPQFKEDIIINAGLAYQSSTDWHTRKPNI